MITTKTHHRLAHTELGYELTSAKAVSKEAYLEHLLNAVNEQRHPTVWSRILIQAGLKKPHLF